MGAQRRRAPYLAGQRKQEGSSVVLVLVGMALVFVSVEMALVLVMFVSMTLVGRRDGSTVLTLMLVQVLV